MDPATETPRWRPRLGTVLLTVNLLILLLPLGGVAVLGLYENSLIQRTESELTVQGALVREAYRRDYLQRAAQMGAESGVALPGDWQPRPSPDGDLAPIPPRLDISRDRVLPPAPAAVVIEEPPDPT